MWTANIQMLPACPQAEVVVPAFRFLENQDWPQQDVHVEMRRIARHDIAKETQSCQVSTSTSSQHAFAFSLRSLAGFTALKVCESERQKVAFNSYLVESTGLMSFQAFLVRFIACFLAGQCNRCFVAQSEATSATEE